MKKKSNLEKSLEEIKNLVVELSRRVDQIEKHHQIEVHKIPPKPKRPDIVGEGVTRIKKSGKLLGEFVHDKGCTVYTPQID
jgi:hypothetical protein